MFTVKEAQNHWCLES